MAADTPYTRTLRRAADALGSENRLADALRVPAAKLQAWLLGDEVPPMQVFSAALDIVASGRASEGGKPPQRRLAGRKRRPAESAQPSAADSR